MSTKYVVIDNPMGEIMYILPSWVKHSDFVQGMSGKPQVVSAGFISINKDECGEIRGTTWGKSHSLGIGSRDRDTFLLHQTLELGEY